MKEMTAADLIGQMHAIKNELASRKVRMRVTIKRWYQHDNNRRYKTIKLVRELSGFSLGDIGKALDQPGDFDFYFTLDGSNTLHLFNLDELGHRYEVVP